MELAFDSMAFLLTIARTIYVHYYREADPIQFGLGGRSPRPRLQRGNLLDNLVRDGAIYFGYASFL